MTNRFRANCQVVTMSPITRLGHEEPLRSVLRCQGSITSDFSSEVARCPSLYYW